MSDNVFYFIIPIYSNSFMFDISSPGKYNDGLINYDPKMYINVFEFLEMIGE